MSFEQAQFPLVAKGRGVIGHADIEGTKHVPSATGANTGDVVTLDANKQLKWSPISGISVASVFGRTGSVIAQAGDYTAAQVGAISILTGNVNVIPRFDSSGNLIASGASDDGTSFVVNRYLTTGAFSRRDRDSATPTGDGDIVLFSGARLRGTMQLRWSASNREEYIMASISATQYDSSHAQLIVISRNSYGGNGSLSALKIVYSSDSSTVYLVATLGNRNSGLNPVRCLIDTADGITFGGSLPSSPASTLTMTLGPASQSTGDLALGATGYRGFLELKRGTDGATKGLIGFESNSATDLVLQMNGTNRIAFPDSGGVVLPELAGGAGISAIGVDAGGNVTKIGSAQSFAAVSASFTYSTSTPKVIRTNGALTITLPAASGFAGYETTIFQEQVSVGSVSFTGPFEGNQGGTWAHHAGTWGWSIAWPKLTLSCDGLLWYVVAQ